MEAYWNKLDLNRPPTITWRCAPKDFDFKDFTKVVEEIRNELESQTFLQTEAALLSRLIYRMKSKLRSDKGLKNMEKINRALLNYLRLSLEKEYKYLRENTEHTENVLVLPSRQMLQYILVRTQGFAKLMCRIENVARESATYFNSRIALGQSWNMSFVAYSVISRIWLLSRHLTKKCCSWYQKIYQYHDKLKLIGISWLPENYCFPPDLNSWLSVPWINDPIEKIPEEKLLSDGIFNLLSHRKNMEENLDLDDENTINAISPIIKSNFIDSKIVLQNRMTLHSNSIDEIGKPIRRDEYAANFGTKDTKEKCIETCEVIESEDKSKILKARSKKEAKKMKYQNTNTNEGPIVENIKTKEELTKLLNLETYPGLDKLRWNMIKKNGRKLLLKLKKCDNISTGRKEDVLLKKIVQSLREWID